MNIFRMLEYKPLFSASFRKWSIRYRSCRPEKGCVSCRRGDACRGWWARAYRSLGMSWLTRAGRGECGRKGMYGLVERGWGHVEGIVAKWRTRTYALRGVEWNGGQGGRLLGVAGEGGWRRVSWSRTPRLARCGEGSLVECYGEPRARESWGA